MRCGGSLRMIVTALRSATAAVRPPALAARAASPCGCVPGRRALGREDRQNNGAPTLLNICGVPLHTGGLHVAPRAQRWRAVLAQRVQRGALSLQRGALSLHRAAVALATPRGVCMMLRSDIMAASMKIAR